MSAAAAPSLGRLSSALFPPADPEGGRTPGCFAVLDGARDERIYRAVYDSRLDYECLFAGELSYELAEAAPNLVHLTPEAPFTRWLLTEGWGRSFGVFAWARADLETLRRHFRRLLQVRDERGNKLFFRYYDPRVLRLYLPTCTRPEAMDVFGPIQRYLAEGAEGQVISYERGGEPLRVAEAKVV